jgi:hypothetical protein
VTLLETAQRRLHNAACALFFGTNNTDARDTYYTALDALTAAHQEGGTWPTSAPTPSSTSDTSTTPR